MANQTMVKMLVRNGLKVTPQRLAILKVIMSLNNHPSAEYLINIIKLSHPNIASGTVYKTLDTYSKIGLIKKVKTEMDITRYEAVTKKHHHLYCPDSERIEDYVDDNLFELIGNYLNKNKIPDFEIKDINLQGYGTFTDKIKETN